MASELLLYVKYMVLISIFIDSISYLNNEKFYTSYNNNFVKESLYIFLLKQFWNLYWYIFQAYYFIEFIEEFLTHF